MKTTNYFYLTSILVIIFIINIKLSDGTEVNCYKKSDIECDYKIKVNSENASNLGTYNIAITLNKIKQINGVFNGKMYINSGKCGTELKNVLEENIQIAQSHDNHGYNFPLFLHREKIEADFCVKILIKNCIDSCAELISLKANLSPIMQMQRR